MTHDIYTPLIHIPNPKVRHKEPLTTNELGITMILLLAGMIISIVLFIFELSTRVREDCIELIVTDTSGKRYVSEWTYTEHPYNWRRNHSNFVPI